MANRPLDSKESWAWAKVVGEVTASLFGRRPPQRPPLGRAVVRVNKGVLNSTPRGVATFLTEKYRPTAITRGQAVPQIEKTIRGIEAESLRKQVAKLAAGQAPATSRDDITYQVGRAAQRLEAQKLLAYLPGEQASPQKARRGLRRLLDRLRKP